MTVPLTTQTNPSPVASQPPATSPLSVPTTGVATPIIQNYGKTPVLKKSRCFFHQINLETGSDEQCRYRLTDIDKIMKCKCDELFCSRHRSNHKCSFNHLEAHQAVIRHKLDQLSQKGSKVSHSDRAEGDLVH